MANLASNPWSFVPGDVVHAAVSGITQLADLFEFSLTTSAPHGLTAGGYTTIVDATPAVYNGFYKVEAVPTTTTATLLRPSNYIHPVAFAAYTSGGSSNLTQYQKELRIEDISWQDAAAPGDTLRIVDKNGNPLWNSLAVAAGTQNRGKLFWCNGFALVQMSSGICLVTIN
jgi:hypothetical protein